MNPVYYYDFSLAYSDMQELEKQMNLLEECIVHGLVGAAADDDTDFEHEKKQAKKLISKLRSQLNMLESDYFS